MLAESVQCRHHPDDPQSQHIYDWCIDVMNLALSNVGK